MGKRKIFAEVAYQYMNSRKKELRPTSYSNYLHLLEKRIIPKIGSINISKLSNDDLQGFINDSQSSGYGKHGTRDCVSIIKLVMKYGHNMGYCGRPVWDVHYIRENKKKRNHMLSDDEYTKLLEYCMKHPGKRTFPTLLSMTAGLRIGEACALKYGDIDFEKMTASITRSAKRVCIPHEASFVEVSAPKTESSMREVPLPLKVAKLLKANYMGEKIYISSENDKLPLEPRSYRQKYNRILKSLGIKPHTFHDLRHTFASRCIDAGGDARTVADILGHANVEMTLNVYTHSNGLRKMQIIEAACAPAARG